GATHDPDHSLFFACHQRRYLEEPNPPSKYY
ncbi:MAG: hypothetical protein ACI8RD_008818, partial [Bacillariaceae sp.]